MKLQPYLIWTTGVILLACLCICCRTEQGPTQDFSLANPSTLSKGDTVLPFNYIHPKTGDWKVEIRISADDLLDVTHRMASRKFTATDEKLLQRIRKLKFLYNVGRPHKASSTLRVYDHTKLHDQLGIVFEKDYMALQSKSFGILTCVDQKEFYTILEEMY